MKKHRQAYIFAILAVLCWSTIASATKITLGHINHIQLLLISSFVAIIILFFMLVIQEKVYIFRRLTYRDLLRSALFGFLNPFAYYLVLFKAYDLLRAQEAVVLNYTWPIALVLLSIPLLKQKISLRSIAAMFISFFGIIVVVTSGNITGLEVTDKFGATLALGSAIIWGLYWIFNVRDKREVVSKLMLNFSFGFVYVLILAIYTGDIKIVSVQGTLGAIYVGVFEMGIAFALWLKALNLATTTAKVSNLIYISPFLSLVFVNIFVGETIMYSSWVGLIFIVSGIILQQVPKKPGRI